MKTVLMAVAVVKAQDKILLRKMDPAKARIKSFGLYLEEELTGKVLYGNCSTES